MAIKKDTISHPRATNSGKTVSFKTYSLWQHYLNHFSAKPTKVGKYPIFVRISVKNDKEYIKTEYQLDDACQWYDGKVVARNYSDGALLRFRYLNAGTTM